MGMNKVEGVTGHEGAFLSLDKLVANPKLARRLSPDLARRFHALPIAEYKGRVTVAMADPEDREARNAVITALGPTSCMVRVDPQTIEALINSVWSSVDRLSLRMLVCTCPNSTNDAAFEYADKMGELLGAQTHRVNGLEESSVLDIETGYLKYDLAFFESPNHPHLHRLLTQPRDRAAMESPPGSKEEARPFAVLVALHPRWPVSKILAIISGEEADEATVDWTVRLARASRSAVTTLAVVPQAPAMPNWHASEAEGLPTLLTANTRLGRRMRQTTRHLAEWEIEGTLRMRQGPPEWQIRRELIQGDYDLIVVAATPRRRGLRCLEGDLADSLFRWTDRPVLIAIPTT
jgi:nucleotide-binding universal stress UspA family protein